MHVTFLVPDIHDRPTGGNLYNRRVAGKLEQWVSVDVVPWSKEDRPPVPEASEDHHVIVDSLLADRLDGLDALRSGLAEGATVVLLVHYLHLVDPTARETDAAKVERAALSRVDGAITTSPYVRRALEEEGIRKSRLGVVPPGLDPRYRAPVPDRSPRATPHLLTVSSLSPRKGLPRLLDVFNQLADRDWTWTLVGDDTLDPPFATALRSRVGEHPCADRLTVTGPVAPSALRAYYDQADLFVLPSRFETCSMAAREAMARACPVVGFAVGGVPENFGDAEAGRLVPPNNIEALEVALGGLIDAPDRRRRLGIAARKRSRAFPTWTEAAERFRGLLSRFAATAL